MLFGAEKVAETVRISGAPKSLVNWVQEAVVGHALVLIQAQEQAHFNLWRDLMGDPLDPSDDKRGEEQKGDNHG